MPASVKTSPWTTWQADDYYRDYYGDVKPDELEAIRFQVEFLRGAGRTFTAAVEWSSAALGYQLQSTTNLIPPVQWIPRTNGISDDGTVRRYIVNQEKPANIFFRLVKP